jgi:hypothetical protein
MAVIEDGDQHPDGEIAALVPSLRLRLRLHYATVPMISRYAFETKPLRLEFP